MSRRTNREICLAVIFLSISVVAATAENPSGHNQAQIIPRGLSYDECFSETFQAADSNEWQLSTNGGGKYLLNAGNLRAEVINNPGFVVDEYYRTCDVPVLTESHDFAFSGRFRISANTFGTASHNGMVFGVGSSILANGGFRQGIGAHIEATPAGSSIKVISRLGDVLQELTGNALKITNNEIYEVYIKQFIDRNHRWIISLELYDANNSPIGVSQMVNHTGLGFTTNRIYLANDALVSDGGVLGIEWFHIGIETDVVPVFKTKLYQARARVDPNDLLQICGYRLSKESIVVYQRIQDTTNAPTEPPLSALEANRPNPDFGRLPVVSTNGVPNSIVVHIPPFWMHGRPYAIWVGDPNGPWSKTILVNDARPAWISPDLAYTSDKVKIVGRNLEPDPNAGITRVRLTGPNTYVLDAKNDEDISTYVETYVAELTLPMEMTPGEYSVQVCRDGTSWVALEGRTLTILPEPPPLQRFNALDYGAIPDDGREDTDAISAAIAAAANAGGGEVYLPTGTYDITEIDLTIGVSLVGAGMNSTRLSDLRNDPFFHVGWGIANVRPIITARGHQTISDLELFDPLGDKRTNTQSVGINLGKMGYEGVPPSDEVTVCRCRFNNVTQAIASNWVQPVKHCTVMYNEFSAFNFGIYIGDVSYSRISRNVFYPFPNSTWNWPSEIGGCECLEFTNNIADGTVNGGWRNGFFWDLGCHSNELVLISDNELTCPGDKPTGYGEGIGFDSNGDYLAYDGMCATATIDTVTIPAGWTIEDQFASFWVRIVDGKGVGQSRRILSHNAGELNRVRLVEPWDVLPDQTSWIAVTKLYWNVFVVDNVVDNRPALTTNLAGVISLYGNSSDCMIQGNKQYDCDGINLNAFGAPYGYSISYFNEIRNNLIEGEPNPPDSSGGIFLWYASQEDWPAPVLGYGAVIKDNIVVRSDYGAWGGIVIVPAWYRPSTPYTWKEVLIFGNRIGDVRTGVHLVEPYAWNTVLFNNTFTNVTTPFVDNGTNTIVVLDTDRDGIIDNVDNCPTTYNSNQEDTDLDGIGDICDKFPSIPNLNPDLVAYYTFDDGTATDRSGYGNDGIIHGARFVHSPIGGVGKALLFDGVDDYVEVPDSPSLDLTRTVSIEVWIKPGLNLTYAGLVSKWGRAFEDRGYLLEIKGDPLTIRGSVAETYLQFEEVDSAFTPILNTWYHVVFVADGSKLKTYVNGNQFGPGKPYDSTINANDNPLVIGRLGIESWTWLSFNGIIDEVRIYNKALSESEIIEHYSDYAPLVEGNCTDGIDNDGDGLIDCADPDCEPNLFCISAGPYYIGRNLTLTSDLIFAGTALVITANNIVIDGQGYKIDYAVKSDGYGIDNSRGFDNITVKNCVLRKINGDRSPAIYYENSDGGAIENNKIVTFGDNSRGESSHAIVLLSSKNNRIHANNLKTYGAYSYHIFLSKGSDRNVVTNNKVIVSSYDPGSVYGRSGIYMIDSSDNLCADNTIDIQQQCIRGNGIMVVGGNNNILQGNDVKTRGWGYGYDEGTAILLYRTSNATLKDNKICSENKLSLVVRGTETEDNITYYNHNIDESNTINGKPIKYYFNLNNEVIENSTDWGELLVTASSNVTIKNITLTENGILLGHTRDSTISSSSITVSGTGILLLPSCDNINISDNLVEGAGRAHSRVIWIQGSNNYVGNNTIDYTGTWTEGGILLDGANSNTVVSNVIKSHGGQNNYGISLVNSNHNNINYNLIETNCYAGYGICLGSAWIEGYNNANSFIGNKIKTLSTGGIRDGWYSFGVYLNGLNSNNTFKFNEISTRTTGIQIKGAKDNLFIGGSITKLEGAIADYYDVYLTDGAQVSFLGVDFDNNAVGYGTGENKLIIIPDQETTK